MLALVLAVLAAAAPQGADKLTTVRAYVYTETSASGQPDEEERGRIAAVKELREALAKKKGISVVDTRADATLLIEITDRETRTDSAGSFGGAQITPMGETVLRMRLRSGADESELKGMGITSGRAAKDAADRILKWIARREPPRKGAA